MINMALYYLHILELNLLISESIAFVVTLTVRLHYVLCAIENEDNEHFLLRCNLHGRSRLVLFNSITQITNNVDILFSPPSELANLLLYGDSKFDVEQNAAILRSTIKFIKDTSRFKKLEAYPDIS